MVVALKTFSSIDQAVLVIPMQSIYQSALECQAAGYNVVALRPKSKLPRTKWKIYQERRVTPDELKHWFLNEPSSNLAIVCGKISNLTVIDCDSPEAVDWYYLHCNPSERIVDTGRGLHFYHTYAPGPNIQRNGIDVKNDGGLVTAPPSIHPLGHRYKWESRGPMTQFNPNWFSRPEPIIRPIQFRTENASEAIERCRRYIDRIEGAISGNNGHRTTFRVACKIAEFLGEYFSVEQAMPLMHEYNQRCKPPWSEAELLHKLSDAFAIVVPQRRRK